LLCIYDFKHGASFRVLVENRTAKKSVLPG
jgi:hypothetical protein